MRCNSLNKGLLLFIACSLLPFSSEAAVPFPNTGIPSTLIPNQPEKNLRELPTPLSKPLIQRALPRPIQQIQIDESNQLDAFILQKVTIKGNTAIPTADLEKYYAPLLNKKITKREILSVVQSLTQYYQSEGYILSFAQTYLLDTTQGIAGIEIIERALTTVKLEGVEALTKLPIVTETQEKILAIKPFRQQDLEKVLLTLKSLPNIIVSSFVQKSNAVNEKAYLVLSLDSTKSWNGRSSIDNYGSNFSGPWLVNTSLSRSAVFNPLDSVTGTFQTATDSQELTFGSIGYRRPVGTAGTIMNITAARTWSEPGYTLKDAELESINSSLVVDFQYPYLRTRDRNFTLTGGAAVRDAQTKSFGTRISRDKVRSVNAGASFDWADNNGGTSLAQVQFFQGIPILGSTANNNALASRENGRVDFSKVTTFLSRTQILPQNFSLLVATEGQYALTQLLSIEEYSYGGRQFGRGYNGGEISGDHGFSALFELQRPITTNISSTILSNPQLFASYDFGSMWRIDTDTRDRQLTGASVAGGIRMGLWRSARVELQVAKPLTRGSSATSEEDAKDWRTFISMSLGW